MSLFSELQFSKKVDIKKWLFDIILYNFFFQNLFSKKKNQKKKLKKNFEKKKIYIKSYKNI